MQRRKKLTLITDLAALAIIAIALAVSMAWSRDIELKLGLLYYVSAADVDEKDIVVLEQKTDGVRVSASGSDGGLSIHYLDVGQGDCTIVEFPDGKTMVIDGGENKKDVETAIQTFIDDTFDESFAYFDYAVLTHPDSDHCGSMDYILNNYPARVVYRPNVEAVGTASNPYTDPGKTDLSAGAATKNTAAYAYSVKAMYAPTAEHDFTPIVYVTDPADENQTITGGDGDDAYSFTFFSPLSVKYTDWNDYSPIMILSYRGFDFAISGDAEKKNEQEFVDKVEAAKTDGVTDKYDIFTDTFTVNAIKCGHHGSRTSTSQAYIDAITTPDGAAECYYIISCGDGNSYGHPHDETLDRLKAMGVPDENILRTDRVGDITLSVRVDDNGEYSLFYGDKASKPIEPDDPPDLPPCIYPEVLVYREFMGIKLKWGVVAWSGYAALVIAAALHFVLTGNGGKSANGKGRERK